MTPIDVLARGLELSWAGLCVLGTQTTQLQDMTNEQRAVYGLEVALLALIVTAFVCIGLEVARVVRATQRLAPFAWLWVLTSPIQTAAVVAVVVVLGVVGVWTWWGSIAAVAVGVAALLFVTDQAMTPDLSAPEEDDDDEDR
ncbi:hypothetical protein ACX31A_09620 [Dermacoccus nishinomiyaensis]